MVLHRGFGAWLVRHAQAIFPRVFDCAVRVVFLALKRGPSRRRPSRSAWARARKARWESNPLPPPHRRRC